MRFFLKYIVMLALALAALTWYIPVRYGLTYPQPVGPQFSNDVRSGHSEIIDNNHIDVVLVGDSTLARSMDENLFSQEIGQPAHIVYVPGSSSAVWYLVLKNIIIDGTTDRPRYVIIFFRDTILTLPDFHVGGGRITEVDEFATANEPFLLKTAYLNFMNPLEIGAEEYFPLYGVRQRIYDSMDYHLRTSLPSLFLSCKYECLDRANSAVFYDIENIDQNFSEGFLMMEESRLFTPKAMNFDYQIDRSFLPEMIRLARENDIQLIFVHSRTLTYPSVDAEPKGMSTYKQALSAYLKEHNIPLLDFSYDLRLPADYFEDPLHMNATGQAVFSKLLAEAFLELTR